jgi:hypothetical protein
MPSIPTFTSKTSITESSSNLKSNFQAPLDNVTGTEGLKAFTKLNDYYAAQQDLTDNVTAKKKFYEMKGTTDQFIVQEKDNYNEENALQNYNTKFNEYAKTELEKVGSPVIREKLRKELDVEYGQGVYHIKKNSFDSLEKESTGIYNSSQTTLAATYQEAGNNDWLKSQTRDQMLNNAVEYNKLHKLSPIDLLNRTKGIETTLFVNDVKGIMGSENTPELFKQLYESRDASKFVKNEDLSKLIIETYKNNISNIAIKGDENSNYDLALKTAKELESLRTPDGKKILNDKTQAEWGAFTEKLRTEKTSHETLKLESSQNLEINTYLKDERDNLKNAFVNKMTMTTDAAGNLAREKATQAETEFNSTVQNWLFANKDKTSSDKKQYITELKRNIIDKYNDNAISDINKISAFDSYQRPINIHRTMATYEDDYKSYLANPNGTNYLKTEAKLRGFVDKKGNPDVKAYFNSIKPILLQRLQQE